MIAEEQSKIGRPLSINALLILNALKSNRRLRLGELAHMIHLNEYKVRTTVEKLVESGLVVILLCLIKEHAILANIAFL